MCADIAQQKTDSLKANFDTMFFCGTMISMNERKQMNLNI